MSVAAEPSRADSAFNSAKSAAMTATSSSSSKSPSPTAATETGPRLLHHPFGPGEGEVQYCTTPWSCPQRDEREKVSISMFGRELNMMSFNTPKNSPKCTTCNALRAMHYVQRRLLTPLERGQIQRMYNSAFKRATITL